jgi:hypothetical protein
MKRTIVHTLPIAATVDLRRRQLTTALLAAAGTVLVPWRGAAAQQAAAATAAAAAAGPLYLIEIVLFRGLGAAAGEDTSAAAGDQAQDNDTTAGDSARAARFGELLPAAKHKLGDVVARLNSGGAKRVLAHAAWTQTAGGWNSGSGPDAQTLGLSAAGFSGQVRLERGQYLHLGFNLSWAATGGAHYTLAQMRRVKPGDRQYYDHPAFAAIAQVTLLGNEVP